MIHNPIVLKSMIAPVVLGGILILAVLTVPLNNHAFAFGNSLTFASPTSSDESNSTDTSNNPGNGQESSNAGNAHSSDQFAPGNGQSQESNSAGNGATLQQSNNAGST
jgi:hypothetical protein